LTWADSVPLRTRHSSARRVYLEINTHEAERLKSKGFLTAVVHLRRKIWVLPNRTVQFLIWNVLATYQTVLHLSSTTFTQKLDLLKYPNWTDDVTVKKQFYGSPTRIRGKFDLARSSSLATFIKCAVSACFPFSSEHKSTKTTRKNRAMDIIQTHLHLTIIISPLENGTHVTVNMNSRD